MLTMFSRKINELGSPNPRANIDYFARTLKNAVWQRKIHEIVGEHIFNIHYRTLARTVGDAINDEGRRVHREFLRVIRNFVEKNTLEIVASHQFYQIDLGTRLKERIIREMRNLPGLDRAYSVALRQRGNGYTEMVARIFFQLQLPENFFFAY